uniref:START domain-containing protein 1 n=1 Tax=Neogobius melanostomus TaxID=47308 RepID=A0A8C6TMN1_9GOBI
VNPCSALHFTISLSLWADISKAQPSREDHWFYQKQGRDAMDKALGMLQDRDGWKIEVKENNGDVICSKVLKGNKKVFRLEAMLDASVDELYDVLFRKVEEMHQWNPSIQKIRVLERVGPETVITHEVSAETAPGNLIGQRDFLSVRHSCKRQAKVYIGGAPVELEAFPPQSGFVRWVADGPTCLVIEQSEESPNRSRLTWLLNMDIKGWLPKSLVNQALPRAQLDFTKHLRRHLSAGGALRG